MKRFEDAIMFLMNGGKARRACWASVREFTQATPPLNRERCWRIWMDECGIIQGWGGSVGGDCDGSDQIHDGMLYVASDEDRVANDWELMG